MKRPSAMATWIVTLAVVATLGRFTPYWLFGSSRYAEAFPLRTELFEGIRVALVSVFSAYWLCSLFRPSLELIAGARWREAGRRSRCARIIQIIMVIFAVAAAIILVWHACVYRVDYLGGGQKNLEASSSVLPYTLIPWVVFTPLVVGSIAFSTCRICRKWPQFILKINTRDGSPARLMREFYVLRLAAIARIHPHVQVCLVLFATIAVQRIISSYGPQQGTSPQMNEIILLIIWIGHISVATPSVIAVMIIVFGYTRQYERICARLLRQGLGVERYAAIDAVGRPTAVLYAASNRHPVSLLFVILALVVNIVTF